MDSEIKTAESAALKLFVIPSQQEVDKIAGKPGDMIVSIRSDAAYERAGQALVTLRSKRKEMSAYFKEAAPETGAGPGQGLCYHARKAWDAANSLFNHFDGKVKELNDSVDFEMKRYRAEIARKAQEEAEAKAALERKRLEAEAAERRRIAEEERKRQEAELAEQRRKSEEERQARLKAESEAAQSKKALAEVQRKADEERRLAELDEEEERQRIEREADAAEMEAQRVAEEANAVVAIPVREAPKTDGVSTRKSYKAQVTNLEMLVKAVASGRAPLACLEWNESGCNKLAQAFGGLNPPPGLSFYAVETTVTRKKRG